MTPKLVNTFPRAVLAESVDADDELSEEPQEQRGASTLVAASCIDVSCGGGFTIVVLKSGLVCSWGLWAHGRLGLGPTPLVQVTARAKTQTRRARYQLRPAIIKGIKNGMKVSCGESHVLLLLSSGVLLSWGQNSCGQVGIGPSVNGFLTNLERPCVIEPFNSEPMSNDGNVVSLRSVHAGSFHSVVVDSTGSVWSWGARGSACLGHYDATLTGPWSERVNAIFVSATGQAKVLSFLRVVVLQ